MNPDEYLVDYFCAEDFDGELSPRVGLSAVNIMSWYNLTEDDLGSVLRECLTESRRCNICVHSLLLRAQNQIRTICLRKTFRVISNQELCLLIKNSEVFNNFFSSTVFDDIEYEIVKKFKILKIVNKAPNFTFKTPT